MYPNVASAFYDYSRNHEGVTSFMYADNLNLVTTGIGNKIDNSPSNSKDTSDSAMAPALSLPWKHKGPGWTIKNPVATTAATPQEIKAAWIKVKTSPINGKGKGAGFDYAYTTDLTLNEQDMRDLFNRTLDKIETALVKKYPKWQSWPADAQLATLSMAWAMGPEFNFPAFARAVNQEPPDFRAAAKQSHFDGGDGNGRNADNLIMFENAAKTIDKVKAGDAPDMSFLFFKVKNEDIPEPKYQDILASRLRAAETDRYLTKSEFATGGGGSGLQTIAVIAIGVGGTWALLKYLRK